VVNFHTKKSFELLLETRTQSLIFTTDEEKYELFCSKCTLSSSVKLHHVDSLLLDN